MKLAKIVGALMLPLTIGLTAPSITQPYQPFIVEVENYETLEERLDSLIARYSKNTEIGIKVVSLKKDKVIYEKKADKKLIPASNIKLITALTALKKLGSNYKFKTELYTDGEIKDGMIDGNLYVKGYGDPYLVSEKLWLIVKDLHNKGIKEIKGDIIGDDSYFDRERHGPGWHETKKYKDLSRAYNAPNGALSLNFNTITVHVKPAKDIGENPIVVLDPDTKYADIINDAQTFQFYDDFTVLRQEIDAKDVISVYGGVSREHVVIVNISKPDEYFITVFKEFLEKEGIKVEGKLKSGVTPEEADLVLTHESKPLSLIVRDLCKYSNNFVADQIVKTLDAEINQKQGTNDGGVEILKDYMDDLGLEGYEIVDGSGYSKKNKLTAKTIVELLKIAYNDFEVSPEYIAALPKAGQDGTLKSRMYILEGKVRAKTGSISNVGTSTISGYIQTEDDVLAFSILMNSKDLQIWQMKYIQEVIIEDIAKEKSSSYETGDIR